MGIAQKCGTFFNSSREGRREAFDSVLIETNNYISNNYITYNYMFNYRKASAKTSSTKYIQNIQHRRQSCRGYLNYITNHSRQQCLTGSIRHRKQSARFHRSLSSATLLLLLHVSGGRVASPHHTQPNPNTHRRRWLVAPGHNLQLLQGVRCPHNDEACLRPA